MVAYPSRSESYTVASILCLTNIATSIGTLPQSVTQLNFHFRRRSEEMLPANTSIHKKLLLRLEMYRVYRPRFLGQNRRTILKRPRQKGQGSGKPSLMPIGTPSNAMSASAGKPGHTTQYLRSGARAACYAARRCRANCLWGRTIVRRNCSVKLWARPPAGLSSMPTEQPTKRPPSTSIGLGAESGDETRGVGPIWSVRQPCRGVSWLASTLGWPVLGGSRYDGGSAATPTRCGLIAAGRMPVRPVFHTLTEQLRPPTS